MICVLDGTLKLDSLNPFLPPLIDPGFLTDKGGIDQAFMRESVRAVQRFVAAPAWKAYQLTPINNTPPASASNSTVDAFVAANAQTMFHPMGTVAMSQASDTAELGTGGVNPDLTVKGTVGLRVADASVFVNLILSFQ